MPMRPIALTATLCATLLGLAGCASKPTTADLMRDYAENTQARADLKNELADQWTKGSKLIATGEKRIENGEDKVKSAERDLKDGKEAIERGREEIAEGQKLMAESQRQFEANFPKLDLKPNPAQ